MPKQDTCFDGTHHRWSCLFQYVHSGSEETSDTFTLIAAAEGGRQSAPFAVRLAVAPVNDETPIVAANTGLCVWEGGSFKLTRNELCNYSCSA